MKKLSVALVELRVMQGVLLWCGRSFHLPSRMYSKALRTGSHIDVDLAEWTGMAVTANKGRRGPQKGLCEIPRISSAKVTKKNPASVFTPNRIITIHA